MSTILVDIDALNVLTIDISTQMWALVNDQASFASLFGFVGECGAKEARANY